MQEDFPCRREDPMICRINPPLGEEEWIFVVVLVVDLAGSVVQTVFCNKMPVVLGIF